MEQFMSPAPASPPPPMNGYQSRGQMQHGSSQSQSQGGFPFPSQQHPFQHQHQHQHQHQLGHQGHQGQQQQQQHLNHNGHYAHAHASADVDALAASLSFLSTTSSNTQTNPTPSPATMPLYGSHSLGRAQGRRNQGPQHHHMHQNQNQNQNNNHSHFRPHSQNNNNNNNHQMSLQQHQDDVNARGSLGMRSNQQDKKSNLYKTEFCRSMEDTGECRYGNKCQFAHSKDELRSVDRHPKYKTQLCKTFYETGDCPYGRRCCFIHSNVMPVPGEGGQEEDSRSPQSYEAITPVQRSKSFSAISPISMPNTPPSATSQSPYGKMSQPQNMFNSVQHQQQQHQQQQGQQQLNSPPLQPFDEEPVSVIPTTPSFFRNGNYPLSVQTMSSPVPADILYQSLARTASPASTSLHLPYSKSNTPVSSSTLNGQMPTRRRVSLEAGTPNSVTSIDNYSPNYGQQQRGIRSRQQSYTQDSISEEGTGLPPLRTSDEFITYPRSSRMGSTHNSLSRDPHQNSLGRDLGRESPYNSLGRDTPSRHGTPGFGNLDNLQQQQQYYNMYQQQQQQQHQQSSSMFSSSLDGSQLATPSSILASSAHSPIPGVSPESNFFESRGSIHSTNQYDDSQSSSLSPLNSYNDDSNFGMRTSSTPNGGSLQRRTRSVTQPITSNEEFNEILYLQQQYSSQQPSSTSYAAQQDRLSSSSNSTSLFQFEVDEVNARGYNGTSNGGSFLNQQEAAEAYGRSASAFAPREVPSSRQRSVTHAGFLWGEL